MESVTRRRFMRGLALLGGGCLLPLSYSGVTSAASGADLGAYAGQDVFSLVLQGQNFLAQGQLNEAVNVLENAVAADPQSDFAHGMLGRAYHALGMRRNAVNHFRTAAQINPEDTYSRMMVDMLTQTPLPDSQIQQAPKTKLELLAEEEERQMAQRISALQSEQGRGLGYRVRRIVLDAGHGGFDSGAVGPTGLQEKNINLELCRRTLTLLQNRNRSLRVFLTRNDDYFMPLSARTAVANQYSADLFVSFHVNASTNRKAGGVETYFCAEKASSKEASRVAEFENSVLQYDDSPSGRKGYVNIEDLLFRFERRRYWQAGGAAARSLQRVMAAGLPMRDRGVHSANFFVLRKARMPSLLLETGFISNPGEEKMLRSPDTLHTIADRVASGIIALAEKGVRI